MPTQKRAEATRESLIQAAATVFADVGYRAATVQDLVGAAGLTQGALYFHFGSKLQLATHIVERQHALSIYAGEQSLQNSASGVEGMVQLSGALARQIATSTVVQAGLRLSTESARELGEAATTPYVEWIAICRQFLERALINGELAPALDLATASEVVISSFTGTQVVSVAITGGEDLLKRLGNMWRLLLPTVLGDLQPEILNRVDELVLAGATTRL